MSVIDPTLRYLQERQETERKDLKSFQEKCDIPFDLSEKQDEILVRVLIRYEGVVENLREYGLEIGVVAGDVATGRIPLAKIEDLAASKQVLAVEQAQTLQAKLNESLSEIRADQVHTGPPGNRGSGVVVGVIDSGIDILHESFRRADGTTRILKIWDQSLAPNDQESSPRNFNYGVEYGRAAIDASLRAVADGEPSSVRHRDENRYSGHGTHVAGIAVGDGSAQGDVGAPLFVGVAPEADLIAVSLKADRGEVFSDSVRLVEAAAYIFGVAETLRRSAVINISLGDDVGAHDGSSLVERGLDNLLGAPGRSIVAAAGNQANERHHAAGTIAAQEAQTVQFQVPEQRFESITIDLWYGAADRFSIAFVSPDGNVSAAVQPGDSERLFLENGHRVFVDSVLNSAVNNDNRIFIRLEAGLVEEGIWGMTLTGVAVVDGRFDAWMKLSTTAKPEFITHVDASRTIAIPATSREMISVGSYVTFGAGVGSLSTFSSRGPTRDDRPAPTLAAPGENIMSARARGVILGNGSYHRLEGTSMAAPHVVGAIALMLERNGRLTQQQIRDCLTSTARRDEATGETPNDAWGAGKLDVLETFRCVRPPKRKFLDDPDRVVKHKFLDDPSPPSLKFLDDLQTDPIQDLVKMPPEDKPPELDPVKQPGLDTQPGMDPGKRPEADTNPAIDRIKQPGMDTQPGTDPGGFAEPIRRKRPETDTNPSIDPIKQPGLEKGPVADLGFGTPHFRGATPFVVSTPHHSNAWLYSYPEAHRATLARLEQEIAEHEKNLAEAGEAARAGLLNREQLQRAEEYRLEYEELLRKRRRLTGNP